MVSKSWVILNPGEQVILEIRAHWVGLTGVAIRLLVLATALGYTFGRIPTWFGTPSWLVLTCRAALVIVFVLVLRAAVVRPFSRWAMFRATLTNNRLLVRFDRRARIGWDLPLLGISEVHLRRGPMQRALGVGSLVITSPMTDGPAVLPNVGQTADHQAALLELRANAWSQYQHSVAVTAP